MIDTSKLTKENFREWCEANLDLRVTTVSCTGCIVSRFLERVFHQTVSVPPYEFCIGSKDYYDLPDFLEDIRYKFDHLREGIYTTLTVEEAAKELGIL
jgi:hypothetical protein